MKKKLTALVLMLCLLVSILPAIEPALAESFTVYVSANTLPVYTKYNTSSSVLGTMSYGESMTCVAYNDSWAAVKNSSGKIGYCKISGLTTKNPNTLNKTAYITQSNVPVYKRPSTSASVMMKLEKNSSYTAVAMTSDKNWVRLKNGKYYGYVQAKYISATALKPEATEAPALPNPTKAPESSSSLTPNTTVYIVANTLKAYKTASTSSKSLGTMSYGESMTLLATSGDWARIRNSAGDIGYCKISGLSNKNPNNLSEKIYINSNGVKAYKKPSTSAGVMQTLNQNESYTIVAVTDDGNWARLKNGKYYAYVQTKYLAASKIENEPEVEDEPEVELPEEPEEDKKDEPAQPAYIASNTLTVYSGPDTSSKKLGVMSYGESIGLITVNDGWAKVQNAAGDIGYCSYGGLTTQNPNGSAKTAYASADGVKLYSQPLEGASVVKNLTINAPLSVVAVTPDGAWARIDLGSGSFAYALVSALSDKKLAEDDAPIKDITPVTVYISATTLTFYAENNDSSSQLGTMSFGESLVCTGTGEGWARVVNASGKVGFCKLDGLTETNPNSGSTALYAQEAGVKVYTKATTSSSIMMSLALNDKVTAVAKSADGSWLRLYNGSTYGYARSEYFASTPIQSEEDSSTIGKIISLAKAQTGIKYVYAAQSPSDGFDCSGFTYYVYKNAAGVTLKRTAYTQATDSRFPNVEKGDLKKGDLVFFDTITDEDSYDHVGIYLGNNKFIHASSGAGKIIESSLASGYYSRTYTGAKRILQ